MTQVSSSSNREASICDAVVMKDNRAVGPLRLPNHRADDFVSHFNRIYAELGMSLAPVAEPEINEKIPGSPQTAGDHDSG